MPENQLKDPDWIQPEWPAPPGVGATITTRMGGVSTAPYDRLNLSLGVGDREETVRINRARLRDALQLPCEPQWLTQVHGTQVVVAQRVSQTRTADACYTRERGLACAVLTADCLPVLICNRSAGQVAAVHAGWRGLAGGILARALACFEESPEQLLVYLGPALSQPRFEVGVEVLEAFFQQARTATHADQMAEAFRPSARPLHFCADLYALARADLQALGVCEIHGGGFCTYDEPERFYSYRRDGVTGRMASLIWIK